MSPAEIRLASDRASRDAALGAFRSDLALVKADLRERSVGGRIADRIGDATLDMVEESIDYAESNKGKLAAVAAAVVVWLARGPITDALTNVFTETRPTGPEAVVDRLKALNPFSRE